MPAVLRIPKQVFGGHPPGVQLSQFVNPGCRAIQRIRPRDAETASPFTIRLPCELPDATGEIVFLS